MDNAQLLQQARDALQRGDKKSGKSVLARLLRENPRNETAWLWMSAIVDDPKLEQECLERVLKLNPSNQIAQQHLNKLQGKGLLPEEPLPEPSIQPPSEQPVHPPPEQPVQPSTVDEEKEKAAQTLGLDHYPQDLGQYAATRLKAGVDRDIVIQELEFLGIPLEETERLLTQRRRAARASGRKVGLQSLLVGVGLVVVGVGASVASRWLAEIIGCRFSIIFTGIAVTGVLFILRGLWALITGSHSD